jgi:hypothetical protein
MHSLQKSAGLHFAPRKTATFLDARASNCRQRFTIMSGREGNKVTLDK